MNRQADPLEGFLCYEDEVALSWQLLEWLPSEIEFTHINESNENLLKATGSFSDHIAESDEFSELIPEFVRLDQKLNLILEFLGVLMTRYMDLPDKRLVNMSPKGISFPVKDGEQCPEATASICLRMYIQPEIPKPLVIYGEVVSAHSEKSAHSEPAQVTIRFSGISQIVEEWLEKFIFRHHRRSVAQQRNL
jgi:Atypical PilZ domain, cyclic di-GMP receptor